uniref:Secreted protein n=1 Tax=Angiostrongylus cantonensis TaxID=6313 RepID=A0A0K0DDT8_ANGCA
MRALFATVLIVAVIVTDVEARKRNQNIRVTVADEVPLPRKTAPVPTKSVPPTKKTNKLNNVKPDENDNSIDDVDEDKIDEILRDASRNLVIFFCTRYPKPEFNDIQTVLALTYPLKDFYYCEGFPINFNLYRLEFLGCRTLDNRGYWVGHEPPP